MTNSALLDTFFGDGNRLSRAEVDKRPRLATLVGEFDIELRRPGLLPRMRETGSAIEWYLIAGTDDDFRRAVEEVQGFIGPTYARWDSLITALDDDDAIDQAVAKAAPGRVLKFFNANADEFQRMWDPLQRLRTAWAQRPPRRFTVRRPVMAIVREIDLALAAGASAQALDDLAELRLRGAISVQNARFIEIRALAAATRWRDVVSHRDFADLCRIRRPWDVTEALAAAVSNTWFRKAEESQDVDGAISAYRQHEAELDQLLRAQGLLRSADALKAVAVRHAAQRAPRASFAPLIERLKGASDRAWAELLSGRAAEVSEKLVTSRDALDAGDFDSALRLAIATGAGVDAARTVLISAYELGSLDAARRAVSYWRELSDALQSEVLSRRASRDVFGELVALTGEQSQDHQVDSWADWMARVLNDTSWPAAAAVARCGELEFEATPVDRASDFAQLSERILAVADSPQRAVLLDGLPSLMRWLERQQLAPSITTPLQISILEALALMPGWDAAGLEVTADLVHRILEDGLEPETYSDVLDTVDLIWERMASRRHAGWFADLVEELEFHPGERTRLISTVVAGLARLDTKSLSRDVREGISLTLTNLGVPEALPPPPAPDQTESLSDLTGKTVGIYSLSPQVLIRVKDRLQRSYPALTIVTNSDHVATDALTSMAVSVELMIVALGSAKHAATGAIDAHRPDSLATRRHAFRGSTRIIEAVAEAIALGVLG